MGTISSTYCVCMFLCSLYAPIHQNKFQVGVNLLGNKYYSDSDHGMLLCLLVLQIPVDFCFLIFSQPWML